MEERSTDTKRVEEIFSALGVGEERRVPLVDGASHLTENSKRMEECSWGEV